MKKFFLTNLLVLACSVGAWACGGEGVSTHNWYMFSMYPHYGNTTPGEKQIEAFWRKYSNDNDEYFYFNGQTMMELAQQKGDTEMEEYLKLLNQFHEICGQLQNTWSYPTKEQLAQRRATLQNMVNVGKSNTSNRMRPQYMLLAMRANMLLGNYQANAEYWDQQASKMPESVYRTMMQGIYANALLHTGHRQEAWDIYALLGDVESLPDSRGNFRIRLGSIHMTVNVKDVVIAESEPQGNKEKKKAKYGNLSFGKTKTVSPEINLIGMNLDDATDKMNKYIDDAFLAGLKTVNIIHGRGSGILRKGLRAELRRNKHVESYKSAPYDQGGEGNTIVTLVDRT